MSKRRKKSPFGNKKGKNIYQNNPRPKEKDSSGDRKGVIQSVKDALDGRKSEASKTPAATPDAKPTATPAPSPTATPAAKPASPSGGLAKEGTAQGMMQEMGFNKSTPIPSADSSGRGSINGMPTAQALSEVKSRVDGILGAADKAPADKTPADKTPPPTPTPYTPPKDEDELKARQGAFNNLMDATSYEVDEYDLRSRQDRIQEARQRSIDAGVPEERVDAVINRNNLAPSKKPGPSEPRVEAAAKMDKALAMPKGPERQAAFKEARELASDDGVSEERIDAYINSRDTPEFRKAQQLKQVREAGRRAAEAGKPKDRFAQFVEGYIKENYGREPSDKEKADWYATEAANLREQSFGGMDGTGGLAENYQLQADKYSGLDVGAFSALGSSKKIAPDSRIIDRYAQKVADGRMTAESARREFGQDMLDKLRYDDPRLFARNEAEYQAAVAEAKRTGSPIPERYMPGADIDFEALAKQIPNKKGGSGRNIYSYAGYGGDFY